MYNSIDPNRLLSFLYVVIPTFHTFFAMQHFFSLLSGSHLKLHGKAIIYIFG
jgi:hypothetical protein